MALKYIHNENATAETIVECIAAHQEALEILKKQLPVACARDGHVWDNPEGTRTQICTEPGLWIEHDDYEPKLGSAGGHWSIKPEHMDVFQRKCTRCGKVENKKPIQLGVKSPWTP